MDNKSDFLFSKNNKEKEIINLDYSEIERVCASLQSSEGKTYDEIAKETGVDRNVVKEVIFAKHYRMSPEILREHLRKRNVVLGMSDMPKGEQVQGVERRGDS